MQSGARVVYVFNFVPYIFHPELKQPTQGQISPLQHLEREECTTSSTWKEAHPEQSSTQKPGSCRQGQAAAGSWAAAQQTDRQTDRRHAHPDCLWWKGPFGWGARRTETKARMPWNDALQRLTATERKHSCWTASTLSHLYGLLLAGNLTFKTNKKDKKSCKTFNLMYILIWKGQNQSK